MQFLRRAFHHNISLLDIQKNTDFGQISQGFWMQMCPKVVPNRIIDVEGVRKPLDRPLDGSWRDLDGSWSALGASTRARVGSGKLKWRSGSGPGRGRGGVFTPLPVG